jgi:hypothetical protein
VVSLDVVGELALGQPEPGGVLADLVVVVLVVAVGAGVEIAAADDLAFLGGAKPTSMRLILVLWVQFGERLLSLVGATRSMRFFSIYT